MVNRREFLRMTAAAGAAVASLRLGGATRAAAATAATKPNIVFILADDLGPGDLGCYGGKAMQTPHIDRLAADGLRFTDFYSGSTVCAPARSVLMTGYHTGHATVRANGGFPIPDSDVTVAEVLKAAGYACGGFGKWGLGDVGTTGVPEKQGFDVFFGYYNQVHAHNYFTNFLWRNSRKVTFPPKTYSHYSVLEETKKFIRESKDKPFFCYCAWTLPHGKYEIPPDDPAVALYKDKSWPANVKTVAAMISCLDRGVGEVRALVKELGLEDRTIIFFTSDNGPANRFEGSLDSAGVLRGDKGALYEGGIRAPMVACWPGRIKPGTVTGLPSYFADMLPTFADLAGAETPRGLDGLSIVPTLVAKADGRKQQEHEYMYWEIGGQAAVRMGRWKGVQPKGKTAVELYDLSKDPGEKNDVTAANPDVAARVAEIMKSGRTDWIPPRVPGPPTNYVGKNDDTAGGGEETPAAPKTKKKKAP